MPFRVGLLNEPVKQVAGLAKGVVGYVVWSVKGVCWKGMGHPVR